MRFSLKPALHLLAALALATAGAALCPGQQSTAPRRDSTQRELQRSLERELLFREMEDAMARGPVPRPTRRPDVTQLNEDFERIQVVNHALVEASAAGSGLDFKSIAQAASEIRKRAGRLKENLLLPEGSAAHPKGADLIEAGQLKASLAALDRLVGSFVSNPGFQSVKVIDPQWSLAARRDLDEIIELSGRLRKSCEHFQKAAPKPH